MDREHIERTVARIDQAHRSAGREEEKPPNRVARVEAAGHWAEVWAAGEDAIAWFYRVSDLEPEPHLIGHELGGGRRALFDSDDPLLQARVGPQWVTPQQFEEYLGTWLREQA